jgi:serine/threonine protein kinase
MFPQDIKPANILLNGAGEAFVTDFGIACVMEGTHLYFTEAAGTVNYMAPEMFGAAEQYTAAVDVWGAGCVVVEMLTGKTPFHGLPFHVCL